MQFFTYNFSHKQALRYEHGPTYRPTDRPGQVIGKLYFRKPYNETRCIFHPRFLLPFFIQQNSNLIQLALYQCRSKIIWGGGGGNSVDLFGIILIQYIKKIQLTQLQELYVKKYTYVVLQIDKNSSLSPPPSISSYNQSLTPKNLIRPCLIFLHFYEE